MMKKLRIALIITMCTFILLGCSKKSSEPMLNLIYNGYTNTTTLVEFEENNTKNFYNQGDFGNNYLKISQGKNLQYKLFNREGQCTLLIQNSDTNEIIKEIVLTDENIDTSIDKGKYIYTFLIEWENGSSKFIKLIEIQ